LHLIRGSGFAVTRWLCAGPRSHSSEGDTRCAGRVTHGATKAFDQEVTASVDSSWVHVRALKNRDVTSMTKQRMEKDMTGRISKAAATVLAVTAVLAVVAGTASAAKTVIYSDIPSPLPGNLASVGFQATQTSEFGGQVEFGPGSWKSPTVKVTMSSFACVTGNWFKGDCETPSGSKFEWPITISLYSVEPDNSVGTLMARASKTFKLPYRPSFNILHCNSENAGKWYSGASKKCFNGKAFNISLGLNVAKLPEKAIVSVAYNTSGYGAVPQGYATACASKEEGCFYDSLNVGLAEVSPTVGAAPLRVEEKAYLNAALGGDYCDGGAAGTGTFRLDSPSAGCWEEFQPAIEVKASAG